MQTFSPIFHCPENFCMSREFCICPVFVMQARRISRESCGGLDIFLPEFGLEAIEKRQRET